MSCMNWYPRWELQGPCFALSVEEYEWSGGEGGRGGREGRGRGADTNCPIYTSI